MVLRTLYDFILYLEVQLGEKGAKPGYSHYEAPVSFRVGLRIEQCIPVHYIELNMLSLVVEKDLDERQHLFDILWGLNGARVELEVEEALEKRCLIYFSR